MTDKRILNDEGLFADPSVPQESVSAADENSILKCPCDKKQIIFFLWISKLC